MQRSKQDSFYSCYNITLTDHLLQFLKSRSWGFKIPVLKALENRAVSLKEVDFHVLKS